MNDKKLGIVVITKKFIKGLITDGDLRRVLNKSPYQNNLEKLARNYPLVINESMPLKSIGLMSEKKLLAFL